MSLHMNSIRIGMAENGFTVHIDTEERKGNGDEVESVKHKELIAKTEKEVIELVTKALSTGKKKNNDSMADFLDRNPADEES